MHANKLLIGGLIVVYVSSDVFEVIRMILSQFFFSNKFRVQKDTSQAKINYKIKISEQKATKGIIFREQKIFRGEG